MIALNERGLPDFRVLQDRMHVRNAAAAARLAERLPATYMVFDVMRVDGRDLTSMPLGERRKILRDLGLEHSTWQVPDAYDDGPMLFDATLQQGLEGIVSKRLTSRYVFGERTRNWLKFAHRHRRSYVVGGWRPQEGTTDRLAALLVGEPTPEGLLYRGRVGSGIGGAASRALTPLVAPLGRGDSPFADEVPRVDARGHVLARAGAGRGRGDPRRRLHPAPAAVVLRRPLRPDPGGPVISRVHVAALLAAGACSPLPGLGADATGRGARAPATVVLDGVRVRLRAGTEQVVTVNHTRGYRARVTFWRLTDTGWTRGSRRTDGRIGYGGLVPRQAAQAGHRHHPARHLPAALGVRLPGATRLVAAALPRGASGATTGSRTTRRAYYNRYRNRAQGGFRWWLPASDPNSSERLTDFRRQYRPLDRHRLQPAPGPAPRGRDLPARQRARRDGRAASAPRGRFIQKADAGARPRPRVPVIAVGR